MEKNKQKYYIRNRDLIPHIYIFRNTLEFDKDGNYIKGSGVITEELGQMIQEIANNVSMKGSFSGYTWIEDMRSEAVLTCIKYLHNFDPMKTKRPNPFSYFTTIIINSFLNYIKKQKKHSDIKDICYKNKGMLDEDNDTYIPKGINYQILKK